MRSRCVIRVGHFIGRKCTAPQGHRAFYSAVDTPNALNMLIATEKQYKQDCINYDKSEQDKTYLNELSQRLTNFQQQVAQDALNLKLKNIDNKEIYNCLCNILSGCCYLDKDATNISTHGGYSGTGMHMHNFRTKFHFKGAQNSHNLVNLSNLNALDAPAVGKNAHSDLDLHLESVTYHEEGDIVRQRVTFGNLWKITKEHSSDCQQENDIEIIEPFFRPRINKNKDSKMKRDEDKRLFKFEVMDENIIQFQKDLGIYSSQLIHNKVFVDAVSFVCLSKLLFYHQTELIINQDTASDEFAIATMPASPKTIDYNSRYREIIDYLIAKNIMHRDPRLWFTDYGYVGKDIEGRNGSSAGDHVFETLRIFSRCQKSLPCKHTVTHIESKTCVPNMYMQFQADDETKVWNGREIYQWFHNRNLSIPSHFDREVDHRNVIACAYNQSK